MKKWQFSKIFLAILALLFLATSLSSCVVFIPSNPIVEIEIVNDNWEYDIYINGNYYGKTDNTGKLTLYDVSPGYHHFEAFESPSILGRYGDKWQTIRVGYNKVNISTN